MFAEVAVNSTFPHREPFSYAIPDGMDARVGSAVYVPFGRLTLQGIVVEVHETPVFSPPEKIRPVRSIIGDWPLIDERHVALAFWIRDRYLAPLFDCVALMLPPGFERKPLTIVRPLVDPSEVDALDLPTRQREVLTAVAAQPSIDLDDLRERLPRGATEHSLAQLERAGLVARQYTLARPRVGPRTVDVVSLAVPMAEARARIEAAEPPKRSRRADVIERLLHERELPVESAARLAGGRPNLDRLLTDGVVRYDRNGDTVRLVANALEAAEQVRSLRRTRRADIAFRIITALDDLDRTLPDLRASVGADAAAVRRLAGLGADFVSIGAITHSAPALDLSLEVERLLSLA
jgi:primosomal protein N' (replication factor Y)